MGGPVTIAKRSKGKVVASNEYTSSIRHVQDMDFLHDNQEHWLHDNLNYNSAEFAPQGYGIVVVDFDSKWIGHIQGYTDPAAFYAQAIEISQQGRTMGGEGRKDHEIFAEAVKMGAITRGRFVNEGEDQLPNAEFREWQETEIELVDILPQVTYEQLLSLINNKIELPQKAPKGGSNKPIKASLHEFMFEPQGWTIERFDESYQGYMELVKVLLTKGFPVIQWAREWEEFVEDGHLDPDEPSEGDDEATQPRAGDFFQIITKWQRERMALILPESKGEVTTKPLKI